MCLPVNDRMIAHRVRRKQIFFDGLLPDAKIQTRLGRLTKSLDQLRIFRAAHPDSPVTSSSARNVGKRLKPSRSVKPHGGAQLPAAPFLVPAVLDALHHSVYVDRVRVVPCEADVACTDPRYCGTGDIIFTSDSDLLVFDHTATVVFFNDIEIFTNDASISSVRMKVYSPKDIAQKLELPDLETLAFHMSVDPHMDLDHYIKKTKSTIPLDQAVKIMLSEFRKDYHVETASLFGGPSDTKTRLFVETLDPRTSEVVQQSRYSTTAQQLRHGQDVNAFLPMMLDDSGKTSAWQPSRDLRRLAYCLLFESAGTICLKEARRSGDDRIVLDPIHLFSDPANAQQCLTEMSQSCQAVTDRLSTVDFSPSSWRLAASITVLDYLVEEGKPLPYQNDTVHAASAVPDFTSWSQVHVRAQVDGALYSLRMLRQILEITASATDDRDGRTELDTHKAALLSSLRRMPTIRELSRPLNANGNTGDGPANIRELLAPYYDQPTPDAVAAAGHSPISSHKSKKRKKSKASAATRSSESQARSTNMFDVLCND